MEKSLNCCNCRGGVDIKKCIYCGINSSNDATECEGCGSREFKNLCSKCGEVFDGDICPGCGEDHTVHTCPDCGGDYTGDACPDCAEEDQYDDEDEYDGEDDNEPYTCPACGEQTYSVICPHCGVNVSVWSRDIPYVKTTNRTFYYQQQSHKPGRIALILLSIALSITLFCVVLPYSLGSCNTSSSMSNEKVQKESSCMENPDTELAVKTTNSPAGVLFTSNGAVKPADIKTAIKASVEKPGEKLLKKLRPKLPQDSEIVDSYADDFNKDNKEELFALVNKGKYSEYDDISNGQVWYVSDTVVKKMLEAGLYRNSTAVWDVGGQKLFRVEEGYGGSGSVSHVWSVRDGKPYELKYAGEALEYAGDQQFYTYPGAFDFKRDGTGGHTWKRYYLYFDKTTGMFKEYGGISISTKDLLKLKNASGILDKINKKGLKITGIFYRSNGIININYISESWNYNLTLTVKDGAVSFAAGNSIENTGDDQGGVYKAAIFKEIATYPDKFIK